MKVLSAIDRLSVFVGEKASVLFLLGVVFTAHEVVMRYVFNAPTLWVHDTVTTMTAVAFLLGGVYAQQADRHIRISVAYDLASPGVRRALDLFRHLVTIGFLALFCWGAWTQAYKSAAIMETSGHAWDVPTPVIIKSAILISGALILLQVVVQLVRCLRPPPDRS